jgi:O-methyltransferase
LLERNTVTAPQLYLDLLKRSLTNTLYLDEPKHEDSSRFIFEFIEHYIKGPAITMLPRARLDNIEACVADVVERGVPGDLIETGVWRGGATIFMRGALKAYGASDRQVWVADSFEGLPEPDPVRFPIEAKFHNQPLVRNVYRQFKADLEEVKANFATYGLLDARVRFLKGWFQDTLPGAPIERLSVMRLDADYYGSTMDALTALYDRLSVGGYVIVDDYGEDAWTYCRKAVDEFRDARGIADPLRQVDEKCYYWQRSA